MDELPEWADGTVAILSTGGGAPHAIPISAVVRAGPRTIVVALALRRESLARLRREPRVALTFVARDVACTALARATIVEEPLREAERVAAVRLDVDELQDHRQPQFELQDAARWRWTDDDAARRDAEVRSGLRRLAAAAAPG